METTEEIRKKIKRLISERGLNYAQVSLALGKNIAYLQQFIKNGSPRRLGEIERHKLATILHVDEQELTDLVLPVANGAVTINPELLSIIIENVEQWLLNKKTSLNPHEKAELIRLLYMKLNTEPMETIAAKIKDYIEIYDEIKKVN
ncbi:MAG: hypothetical protein IJ099_02430 [Alphaproteobacteria bacterium]|nr:hypothetical protein [Alphaproteobacteria bacterium]